ncbi:putative hydrolase of the HAD superfamily [Lentibacillus halodurans]|uniref:Phosphoserine phosphatase n=1 Tax=Lentibacillus halodurans TaxID=237679 RepID=A0A1I0ZU24_9BACI|nr:HAD family hydrolase [Lentibacillus halodurans]SFB28596.1 putative hydrolase of the HAD superfamily [Lentibacillus halodurans]
MLKAIMFDLDDTLIWDEKSVDQAFKKVFGIASQKSDVDPEALEQRIRKNAQKLFASYDTYDFTEMIGISPFEGLWGEFDDEGESFNRLKEIAPKYRKKAWTISLQESGVDNPQLAFELAEVFKTERGKKQFVYEETFDVLNALKGKYRLLMLTNGSPDLQWRKLAITPGLKPYFDHIVISGGFGKGKPNPSIMDHALGLLSVEKDEVIMVGDNPYSDILGASRAGIPSVWINHHAADINDVRPTYEISRLKELLNVLEQIDR